MREHIHGDGAGKRHRLVCALLAPILAVASAPADPVPSEALVPRPGDRSCLWWANGFPPAPTGAPLLARVEGASYVLALDAGKMSVVHFRTSAMPPVAEAPPGESPLWLSMKPADLTLRIDVGGTAYRCRAGGPPTQHGGPRLVEAGRFFQRMDVTGLIFESDTGEPLRAETRFELSAWPDRIGFRLFLRPEQDWRDAAAGISFAGGDKVFAQRLETSAGQTWQAGVWREVALGFDPVSLRKEEGDCPLGVYSAPDDAESGQKAWLDPATGWHLVELDAIPPSPGPGKTLPDNDAIGRVRLRISNPAGEERVARLMFRKTSRGLGGGTGSPITGISAILRDADGVPTGIPVQLSKNWHENPEEFAHSGTWFHGLTQLRMPAGAEAELELVTCHGHWGGMPAASQAQLCLIGWGSNQHWSQGALGAWGESVCFEPDQAQAQATITDFRPLMVRSAPDGPLWQWTSNIGGGDFLRIFGKGGEKLARTAMRTEYLRYGPCLTEVRFSGNAAPGIRHHVTASLSRGDDLMRATYRLRMDVDQATDVSRFVVFQVGADSYNYTAERKMALGEGEDLTREWDTQWGGDAYKSEPTACRGEGTWVSLHRGVPQPGQVLGAWGNRGFVIRGWNARLGGKETAPWIAERGHQGNGFPSSTADIIVPPGLARLEPGDFVEATIEHYAIPQSAAKYYGGNEALRQALEASADTWRMVAREASEGRRTVRVSNGTLEHLYPDVRIKVRGDHAELALSGGTGFIPVTFVGLGSPRSFELSVDGEILDQSVHGHDFWQADHDAATGTWSLTYNIPASAKPGRILELRKNRSTR